MEYVVPQATIGVILCCDCGIQIEPNPTNRCIACVRTHNDISECIPKQSALFFCSGCERYLDPPQTWIAAQLESKELLRVCLKKLKGLNKVRLVDAGFAWTEPHSKRIKVKVTVQKEIQVGAVLQQEFVVEYVVNHQMCDDCHRIEAKDYWKSLVQVRQKADHKRTFYYLEQLILKHKAHEQTLGIKPVNNGLDFYYSNEQGARRMVDFLMGVVPCKWTPSKKLISHDIHSNSFNYKFTFSVEISPICKDSIVCLPQKLAHHLGGIGQLCIVTRVTNNISVIDPITAQVADVSSSVFWRSPFNALCTSKHLSEFIVMDTSEANVNHFMGQGQISAKHQVAEVWVQRSCELGSDNLMFCRTHLGHILSPGDTVLGFDIRTSNLNDDNFEKLNTDHVPDVILVKKIFADKAERNRRRRFKLRHLNIDDDTGSQIKDYTDFLEDLEEDEQMRGNVNIYRDTRKTDVDGDIGGELPTISLDEMLDDLVIEKDPIGNEGAEMVT